MEMKLGIVKELFLEVVSLPPDQRDATLTRLTGDADVVEAVRQLLVHHEQGAPIMDGGVEGAAAAVMDAGDGLPPNAEEFAPYRVLSRLGEGGMGVVFLAVRDDLGMRVAIKVLRDAWLSPSRRRRFATEQRLLARMSHPGIARILDARTLANGTPWFAMEYVDGTGIQAHCVATDAPIPERVRLFREVCEAMRYAHAEGVVHRDLKPSNILVTRDGAVRLLDFGIARAMPPDDQASEGGRSTLALMTPAYAAPEQRERREPTPRSDVYSLGVILHELVTGSLPQTPAHGHERSEIPPSASVGPVPGSSGSWPVPLERICLKALQADPASRYEDAGALLADLDRFLTGKPVHAVVPARRDRRRDARRVLLVGAAVALIAASLASWQPAIRMGSLPAVPVVAVLPFSNEAGDSTLDYLRHAIGEELATALGLQPGISMRAYATTSAIDPDTITMATVGKVLRVSHVVGGTFAARPDGGVGVDVQLVRADSGRVLLSFPVVVEPQNAVSLQSQLASLTHGAIAAELGVATQRPNPTTTRPRSERAYQLYLRSSGGR
jgi:TolB-like protein